MKSRRDIEALARQAPVCTNEQADERVLNKMREAYAHSAQPGGSPARLGYWDLVFQSRFARLAAAAVVLLALGALIGQFGAVLPGGGVAWADVTQRFQSVPFFSATIYIKDDAPAEPRQMELWMSRDGRARIRLGSQVVFAQYGQVIEAFDIKSRSIVEPDEWAVLFLERIGRAGELSLDTVIRVMFGGEMQDVTPLVNPAAVISQDIVVFDVELPGTPEWVRIWALRESRLPVRIRVWDPRNGNTTDAIFEYSREQADEFFDPNAFETLLQSRRTSSRANIAYAFLKDPGGRDITPEDMFAGSGYHVPEIEQVGITPDGAVWVIAARGRNRMPDGRNVYGFTRIEDDLGREYEGVYKSHRTATDQSMEVFVPGDYPFDERVPGRITLICEADDGRPTTNDELIGSVELTAWQHGRMWPEGTIRSSEQMLRIRMAWRHSDAKRFEQAERVLVTIEGAPEDGTAALQRERLRLRMLVQQAKYDEAVALAERLIPLLEADYRRWDGSGPDPREFVECVLALVHAGRLDAARQLWRQIKSIEPQWHPKLNQAARANIADATQRGFEDSLRIMVPELSRQAHLTIAQLNDVFAIDIKNDELFKYYTFWDWNPELEKPKYRNWERHLAELAEYYQTHPLPASMEILAHAGTQEYGGHLNKMPGVDGYEVHLLSGTLAHHARFYRYPDSAGRVRVEPGVADVTFDHDLVYRDGTPWLRMNEFVLDSFGLEIAEVNEPRRVWVARHDGRELKDFREVLAPIPHDGSLGRKAGTASSGSIGGFKLTDLFNNFMADQNKNGRADCILILDETGISAKVSREIPCWEGPEAIDIARKWFADEFGITFTEETRMMTTYVIRPKP